MHSGPISCSPRWGFIAVLGMVLDLAIVLIDEIVSWDSSNASIGGL
jgi:hypothetical protein